MNTRPADPPPLVPLSDEAPFPPYLHAKIMKRVFFAGYGRYLYLAAGILFLNVIMLGLNLYYTLADMSALDLSFARDSLYDIFPLGSIVSIGFIAVLCSYFACKCVHTSRTPWTEQNCPDLSLE